MLGKRRTVSFRDVWLEEDALHIERVNNIILSVFIVSGAVELEK